MKNNLITNNDGVGLFILDNSNGFISENKVFLLFRFMIMKLMYFYKINFFKKTNF